MARFNRTAAVVYATSYAKTPNPSYPPYPNDCTSFISQCMRAGGWPMSGGSVFDRQDDDVWWWGKSVFSQASYTWGGAHNFSKYIARSGRGKICSRSELDYGDVVQIANGGHVFHSMIVTAMICSEAGDGPHMSFHTTNTLNKFLGTIEASYSTPAHAFLYWKVNDTI